MKVALKFALITLTVFSASCKVSQYTSPISKGEFVFAYKAEACTACLTYMGAEIKDDNSPWLRFEVLGDNFKKQARLEGKNFTDTINQKARYFKGGDLEGGKAITNGCLLLFESRHLDSAAKAAYRQFLKQQKAIWGGL
ncbi:hypothetical protein [Mucilaginibacter sp. CSA2-8R]|uniref:hypothetical protein n=1 Tax=Mucilaginibacter sp. CSA2-8R TaxID=3141542 RepID=UPI00315C76B6